jgi:hypothetical protein
MGGKVCVSSISFHHCSFVITHITAVSTSINFTLFIILLSLVRMYAHYNYLPKPFDPGIPLSRIYSFILHKQLWPWVNLLVLFLRTWYKWNVNCGISQHAVTLNELEYLLVNHSLGLPCIQWLLGMFLIGIWKICLFNTWFFCFLFWSGVLGTWFS